METGYASRPVQWRMSLSENRCRPSCSHGHPFPGHPLTRRSRASKRADAKSQFQPRLDDSVGARRLNLGAINPAKRPTQNAIGSCARSDASTRTAEAGKFAQFKVEKAAVDGERKAVEADLGPVKYLGTLLGTTDEATMRWFILVVTLLLDPAAVLLLLAATKR